MDVLPAGRAVSPGDVVGFATREGVLLRRGPSDGWPAHSKFYVEGELALVVATTPGNVWIMVLASDGSVGWVRLMWLKEEPWDT